MDFVFHYEKIKLQHFSSNFQCFKNVSVSTNQNNKITLHGRSGTATVFEWPYTR